MIILMIIFVRVGSMSNQVRFGIPSSLHKKNGKWHMAVDYQTLNAWIVPNRHSFPYINDFLDYLHGCTHFTMIDL